MKQEEKSKRTRARILQAAMIEFGTKSYDMASINVICSENQISKGLLYHHFKNKDALYLECVKVCFEEMMVYMSNRAYKTDDIQGSIRNLLDVRQKFFQENPYCGNIFFNTILQPPEHLTGKIGELRREFDDFYRACYKDLLDRIPLRKGISMEMAMEYFLIFQEMFNGYFRSKACENNDFHILIEDHEMRLSTILDIMLYGIADEKEERKR